MSAEIPTGIRLERTRVTPMRLWWGSTLLWYATRWMDMATSSWLMLVLTDSPAQVALLGFYRVMPMLLLGLVSGAITERFSRRTLLLAAQLINFITIGSLTALLFSGLIAPWHVIIATFVSGCVGAIEWPVRRSTLTDLVGFEHITPSIVFENILSGIMKISGPLVAGALIGWFGLSSAYSLETIIFALSLGLLFLIPLPLAERMERQPNLRHQIAAGLHYIKGHQVILGVLAITIVQNVFGFTYGQMLSVFARDILDAGPTGLGLLSAMDGIGSFLGAVLLRWFSRGIRGAEGLIFIFGSLLMVVAVFGFSLSTIFGLSALLILTAGLGSASFSAFQSSLILRTVSIEMRSRVLGVLVLCIGSAPLGSLFMGALSAGIGPAYALAISAGFGITGIVASYLAFPGLRKS